MKTILTLTHELNGVISGNILFHDGAQLELWPGQTPEITAQIHSTLRIATGKHGPSSPGTSFQTWGHALLKKAVELKAPRYCIDQLLNNEPNFNYSLNWRLMFFPTQKLLFEERVFTAAVSFDTQMISGVSWFLDNELTLWFADARKALNILNAKPYLALLDDVISRLQFHGISVSDSNTHQKWYGLTENAEAGFRKKFDEINRSWWDLWNNPETKLDMYTKAYVRSKIEVFRTRSGRV